MAIVLLLVQFAFVLVREFRHPGKAVAWLMIVLVVPFAGFLLYFFLARDYSSRRAIRRQSKRREKEAETFMADVLGTEQSEGDRPLPAGLEEAHSQLIGYLRHMADAPITRGNTADVYATGEPLYEAMMAAMEQARDHIHAAFYIIRDDEIGRQFKEIWMRKARAGVKVRILYDGVGSYPLKRRFVADLRRSGVETCIFLPPLMALVARRINYRNHRKMLIVDGHAAFIGGYNIGEEYVGRDPKLGFWRDTHLKIGGKAALCIQRLFLSDWALAAGKFPDPLARYYPPVISSGKEAVQVIAGGPDKDRDVICGTIFAAINAARKSVFITTPYFIPDPGMIAALKSAATAGIDVRIILPGKSDSRLVHGASLSYMEEMLQAGVRGFLYQKGFIHAKVVIVDEQIATTGTANMDMRSFFSNFELNVMLFDGTAVARLVQDFYTDLAHCEELNLTELAKRGNWQRMQEIGARLLSPLL